MSAPTVLQGGASDRYPGRRVTVENVSPSTLSHDERLMRVSRMLRQTPRQLAQRYGTDGKMTASGLQKAERHAGVEYRAQPMPFDAHFGGTGVSLQSVGDRSVPLDSDSLLYAMKAFKRKLQQGIDAKKRQNIAELTGEMEDSQRPAQLVHSCDTAGPGLTYCDPMVPNNCPDPKTLVGTPYENIYSTIGVPPNNKVVQCVPRDLVPIQSDSEKKEEDVERRMHRVMTVLAENAKNIYKLSKWREAAPCDSIPAVAFGNSENMCRTMHFPEDKMATRCMDYKAADRLLDDTDVKEAVRKAKDNPDEYRTCFANPKELSRKINERIHRVGLWRQKLKNAVEDAMRVPDFVQMFDKLGKTLQEKYGRPKSIQMDNAPTPPAISWNDVNIYMTHDIQSAQDLLDKTPCKDAKKEAERLEALLSGGGKEECDDLDCNHRLLRVLKIMHKTLEEERQLKLEFGQWSAAHRAKIEALKDDENCNQHSKTDNYCKLMKDTCPDLECSEIEPYQLGEQCVRTPSGKYVYRENYGVTWGVERFTDDGEPIGFRWLAEPDVRDMFESYTRNGLQSCAFNRNQLWSTTEQLSAEHRKRTKKLMGLISKHYSDAAIKMYKSSFDKAVSATGDSEALRKAAEERKLELVAQRAVEKAMQTLKLASTQGTVPQQVDLELADLIPSHLIAQAGEPPNQARIELIPKELEGAVRYVVEPFQDKIATAALKTPEEVTLEQLMKMGQDEDEDFGEEY